ncbi:MAG TPA: amidohydrolase family protein [Candidatus Binatia bacterium]|jgi:predicted TIM-barrel fold metal-dependent hydrolase
MAFIERTYGKQDGDAVVNELLISSDSHVIEPEGLWKKNMPQAFRDRAPDYGGHRPTDAPGAMDKNLRVSEMKADGVSGEVLYPTHGLKCLSLDDPELEAACCRVYNDWLIDYCRAAPDRLIGIAMLSMYNVDDAIKELERCRAAGLRGSVIWQVPPPELSFASDHYEKFWAASQNLDMPVNVHILSGHGYSRSRSFGADPAKEAGFSRQSNSVNMKLFQSMNSLYEIIFSGVLERFPRLKFVLVENEIGWIPFVLEQWDYYFKRHGVSNGGTDLKKLPSEYFHQQVYTTFFNDAVGGHILSWWGADNCMWSNDFPHGNSTWPESRKVVARDLGNLPAGVRAKLVRENVAKLYKMPIPAPVA